MMPQHLERAAAGYDDEAAVRRDGRKRQSADQFVIAGPAGRLVAWNNATGQPLEPELPISIGLVEDPPEKCSGPIWLRGGIPVVSADGFAYEVRNRMTLCRCGASRNKPFCDGTHAHIKFKDGI